MYFYINKSDPGGQFHKHTFIFNYIFLCGWMYRIIKFLNFSELSSPKSRDFLLLNINILILHYVSMQSEIYHPRFINSLKQYTAKLEAENDKIRAENTELKARIAKLEDKQTQNELIKNLLSVPHDKNHQLVKDQIHMI